MTQPANLRFLTEAALAMERAKLAGIAAGATVNRADSATDAAISTAVGALVGGASAAYDTLGELATQLASDENAAAALATLVGTKAPLASPAFTGTPTKAGTALATTADVAALSLSLPVNVMAANGTVQIGARNSVNASAGPIAVTLPAPTAVGQHLIIERADASAVATNTVTITGTIRGTAGTVVTLAAVGAAFEGALYVAESLTSWAIASSIKPRAVLDASYVNRALIRRRDLPGYKGLPTLNTAAATTTNGVASAASAIAGSVLVSPYATTAFTYFGTVPSYGSATFPDRDNFISRKTGQAGDVYPSGNTSNSPWGVEFDFDTTDGLFEVSVKGTGAKIRLLVNGQYVTAAATFTTVSDGSAYLHLVNLGAAGTYRIRLEFDGTVNFYGIRTIVTNGVRAAPPRMLRCIVLGDSFTEPTIIDSGAFVSGGDGWVQKLGYLTGWDVWSAGKGGTGYLNAGTAVTFLNRIGDVTRNNPDVVILAGGINDTGSGTVAQFRAQVDACVAAVKAAVPAAVIIILPPFWRSGFTTFPANQLAFADAAKASAAAAGALFLDFLRFPAPPLGVRGDFTVPTAGTLSAAAAINATTFASASLYPVGTIVQVGADGNAEARSVTATSGTGPYTHTVAALSRAHVAGDPVIPFGGSFVTGTGKQGTPVGDGTADRYTGSDGTHPTVAGHANIARTVFELLAASVPA